MCSPEQRATEAKANAATALPLIPIAAALAFCFVCSITLFGCEDLTPRDTRSLLFPAFQHSEIIGAVAGLGTTFAAVPDLIAMLKRGSSIGMNPRMAGIMGVFQIVWVYYGLLIALRPVIVWNVIAVMINFLSVGAHVYFFRRERSRSVPRGAA